MDYQTRASKGIHICQWRQKMLNIFETSVTNFIHSFNLYLSMLPCLTLALTYYYSIPPLYYIMESSILICIVISHWRWSDTNNCMMLETSQTYDRMKYRTRIHDFFNSYYSGAQCSAPYPFWVESKENFGAFFCQSL